MLPFDSPEFLEPLQIEGLSIPRYGSLTVNESRILPSLLNLEPMATAISRVVQNWQLQVTLATLLLISRDSPTWTLEMVQELDPKSITALAYFFANERDRWGEGKAKAKSSEGTEEPKPIDWTTLYWRLRLAYPDEERFSAENFGNCPLVVVEQALETLQERELQQANALTLPTALLGINLLAAQRVNKPKLEWFSPYYKAIAQRTAREKYPQEAAQTFLQLAKDGSVPSWALKLVDMDAIALSAAD